MSFSVCNTDGVVLMVVGDNGKIAISRNVRFTEQEKEYIAETYVDLTGKTKEEAIEFLNFDNEELYCS